MIGTFTEPEKHPTVFGVRMMADIYGWYYYVPGTDTHSNPRLLCRWVRQLSRPIRTVDRHGDAGLPLRRSEDPLRGLEFWIPGGDEDGRSSCRPTGFRLTPRLANGLASPITSDVRYDELLPYSELEQSCNCLVSRWW